MNCRNQKGISLLILCITIVVMMIIAGASINMLFDAEGLFKTSQETQDMEKNYSNQQEQATNEFMNQVDKNNETEYKDSSGANPPKLGNGMIPVKWDGTNWIVTDSKDSEWYSYADKKWANVMLTDGLQVERITDVSTASLDTMKGKKVTSVGSMFVWIPRYAYQIDNNWHTNSATGGVINIKFLKGLTNTAALDGTKTWDNTSGEDNWNVHPAFEYGEAVSGIWVAKFEASHTLCTIDVATGQTNTNVTNLQLQVKPGVTSWRNITISNIYDVCLKYRTVFNSHQMKNVEWGAVAYLAQSVYGKNSEVWINNSSSYITGSVGNSVIAELNVGTTNDYTSSQGINASTTGNVYGIYDISGGAFEYVAAYVNNGHSYLKALGESLINGKTKTKDVYRSTTSTAEYTQAEDYEIAKEKYGDAIYETSSSSMDMVGSWYAKGAVFPTYNIPFFIRGGDCESSPEAGMFYFNYYVGYKKEEMSFRPVLCIM